jgi:hypothetical protein
MLFLRVPLETDRRTWIRGESPALIDVWSWEDGRLIASVMVYPVLDSPTDTALEDHKERVQQVKEVLLEGTERLALNTYLETHGMKWDPKRLCWVADDHRYDASRFGGRLPETPSSSLKKIKESHEPPEILREDDGA